MCSVGAVEPAELAMSTVAHAQYSAVYVSSQKCRDVCRRCIATFGWRTGLANRNVGHLSPQHARNVEITSFLHSSILRRWLWTGLTRSPNISMCPVPRLPAKHFVPFRPYWIRGLEYLLYFSPSSDSLNLVQNWEFPEARSWVRALDVGECLIRRLVTSRKALHLYDHQASHGRPPCVRFWRLLAHAQ